MTNQMAALARSRRRVGGIRIPQTARPKALVGKTTIGSAL
jgi:hypothetical protein